MLQWCSDARIVGQDLHALDPRVLAEDVRQDRVLVRDVALGRQFDTLGDSSTRSGSPISHLLSRRFGGAGAFVAIAAGARPCAPSRRTMARSSSDRPRRLTNGPNSWLANHGGMR